MDEDLNKMTHQELVEEIKEFGYIETVRDMTFVGFTLIYGTYCLKSTNRR